MRLAERDWGRVLGLEVDGATGFGHGTVAWRDSDFEW